MGVFELVVAVLLAGALLAAWARRVGLPYPALLSLAGAIAAVIPGTPAPVLEPNLALALFVAPTLLDAAFDTSPRDLRDNWIAVALLAVVAVVFTVAAVAWVARAMVPGLSWAAAVALGAVVAPPDASAATAVLRQLRPPHRLLVILEGESLLNDATALIIYRVAVGAAAGGAVFGWQLVPEFLITVGGGAVLGFALARLFHLLPTQRGEIPTAVLTQFLSTFAVWMVADRLGVSAIITMVVYAMSLARSAPLNLDARHRIASYAVWEVAVFVLNLLAFVLIGLQLKSILAELDGHWGAYAAIAAAICLTVIVVRVAWVMAYNTGLRCKIALFGPGPGQPLMHPTASGGLVIAWCGMRGIVTLATALALPDAFPDRGIIVFSAFWVVLGTLALQGLTLRPLLRRLPLPEDRTVEEETALAREGTARAALQVLEAEGGSKAARILRLEYTARAQSAPAEAADIAGLQRRTIAAQREALFGLRRSGTIGEEAFHAIEEELDVLELTADPRIRALGTATP